MNINDPVFHYGPLTGNKNPPFQYQRTGLMESMVR